MRHPLSGIHTAVPTPLDGEGKFIPAVLVDLIDRLLRAGADGIVPLGGTGEFTALPTRDRRRVVETCLEAVAGRVPVIPGILHPGIGDAVMTAQEFVSAGAKTLMVVTPYYFRPSQDGIVDYYKQFSDLVDADIVLYEIPYRTGVSLAPETIASLVDQTRVVGIKACNTDLSQQMRVAEMVAERIAILSGEEEVFPLHVAMGAVGGIFSSSNLFTRRWRRILDLAQGGDLGTAIREHAELRPVINAVFSEPNPAPIKAALELAGLPFGGPLPPLRPASSACRARLAELILPLYLSELDEQSTMENQS